MNKIETKKFIKTYEELSISLSRESDRGCVLVVRTLLENVLSKNINERLLDKANRNDIVSRSIRSLGAKIDFSYRLGIITLSEHKIYHHLRQLRNECAHNIEEQTFDKNNFQKRIENMIKESSFLWEIYKK